MPAYLLAFLDITDPQRFELYKAATPAILASYGGRFLVRGGPTHHLEGPPESRRTVIIEFPSLDHARNFWNSPDYQQVKQLRQNAAQATFFLAEAYPG